MESIIQNSNIINEFNELIKEYNNQKLVPTSIFYKIKLFSFLNGKYKYYKLYINNDIISYNKINIKNIIKKNIKNENDKNTDEFEETISKKNLINSEELKIEKKIKVSKYFNKSCIYEFFCLFCDVKIKNNLMYYKS